MSVVDLFWPKCTVNGCPFKCCIALDSKQCFPHTPGNRHVKHWKIDARALPTRIETVSVLPLMNGQR